MAAAQGPLRRWKRFLPAFASIDATIEAYRPDHSRSEFRNASLKILEMLIDEPDATKAEKLCVMLDDLMIQKLLTLEMVPAMPKTLASTDLAQDVCALRNHESGRVRGLATGIVRQWRASVKADLAKASAAMDKLSQVLEHDEAEPSATKKLPAGTVGSFRREGVATSCRAADEKAINAAKRKLREGYQEAEDAKRQRMVRVIEAPPVMAKKQQRERKTHRHPILQQRNQSRASHTALRRRV